MSVKLTPYNPRQCGQTIIASDMCVEGHPRMVVSTFLFGFTDADMDMDVITLDRVE